MTAIGSLPLVNNRKRPSAGVKRQWLIVGNPENRRVTQFTQALAELGHPSPVVVPYVDYLRDPNMLLPVLSSEQIVRIESPGENHAVERMLIARGAAQLETASSPNKLPVRSANQPSAISSRAALRLRFDRGRVWYPALWYAGFSSVLHLLKSQVAKCEAEFQNHPDAIAMMFDKPTCQRFLASKGISVPNFIEITSYDQLLEEMRTLGWKRAFVKLACGSSSSGVIAFDQSGSRPRATTSLEVVRSQRSVRLYNSLRIRTYTEPTDIAYLINWVLNEHAQVEQWLPRAVTAERAFDSRIVTIAGKPMHTVVRLAQSPMSNLHLGNQRGDVLSVRRQIGKTNWNNMIELVTQAASLFPKASYVGWDVLLTPGGRSAYILEANAFGDLLPGITYRGMSTYQAEIRAMCRRQTQ